MTAPQTMHARFFRLRLAATHMLFSFILVGSLIGFCWWRWYQWPAWYLVNVLHILITLIVIDLVLGPTLSFIIGNPKKTWRVISRDLMVIITVQLVALAWGIHTLWGGRPAFSVYVVDRFELVQANQIPSDKDMNEMHEQYKYPTIDKIDPQYRNDGWRKLLWIWAEPPQDEVIKGNLSFTGVFGVDLSVLPYFYRPLEQGKQAMLARASDYATVKEALAKYTPPIEAPVVSNPAQTVAWPISSQANRFGIVFLDKNSLEFQAFVPIDNPFALEIWPRTQVKPTPVPESDKKVDENKPSTE